MLSRRQTFAAIGLLITTTSSEAENALWRHFAHHADFAALGGLIDIPVGQAISELQAVLQSSSGASEIAQLDALQRQVIIDFKAERTVSVRGWMISRTEALMAVIAHHGQELA